MNPTTSSIFAWNYRHIIKPFFFLFDAEFVHNHMTLAGKLLGQNHITQLITRSLFSYKDISLQRKIDGVIFPNPIGLSAGFDYNGELVGIIPEVGFGFHTIGTITWEPYQGNIKPRLGRLPNSRALIVNKGLKNIGTKNLIRKLKNYTFRVPTGISIAATNKVYNSTHEQILDMLLSFQAFERSDLNHAYYELNISCPNTFGGEPFTTPQRLSLLLRCVDALHLTRPLYIKMPIDQTEAETLALLEIADKHLVQGIIIGNLTKDKQNPAVTPEDAKTWSTTKGNLSGKPTWQRSNTLIELTKKTFKNRFTIIGVGGVFSGEDAETKMKLGADLVQLITGMIFEGPQVIGQINHHLAKRGQSR